MALPIRPTPATPTFIAFSLLPVSFVYSLVRLLVETKLHPMTRPGQTQSSDHRLRRRIDQHINHKARPDFSNCGERLTQHFADEHSSRPLGVRKSLPAPA